MDHCETACYCAFLLRELGSTEVTDTPEMNKPRSGTGQIWAVPADRHLEKKNGMGKIKEIKFK